MIRFQPAILFAVFVASTAAQGEMIGIYALLNRPPTDNVLADLRAGGRMARTA